MAEFQKVIAEWKRLCKSRLHLGCSGCPVNNGVYCRIGNKPFDDDFEYEILKWAAANPEPRYPTWREWHHTTFPDVRDCERMALFPCAFDQRLIVEVGCPPNHCDACRNKRIAADIAKKLGVEPIREDK